MTQDERRLSLIKGLLAEETEYYGIQIPAHLEGQKRFLRSLMNVRPPHAADPQLLKIQDEYLTQEIQARGIVDADALPVSRVDRRLVLWRGDITTLKADAIVNAANSSLRGCFIPCHSCVDNIIHSGSGIQLRLACDEIMRKQGHEEPVGTAKITPAFNLPCRYVIHTVGPLVSGPLTDTHCGQLADCYRSCLQLASEHDLTSVAFCCISTGEFHFQPREAAAIAVDTVKDFLRGDRKIKRVVFNVFKPEDYEIYRKLLG